MSLSSPGKEKLNWQSTLRKVSVNWLVLFMPEERLWRRLPMGSDESAAMFARRQPKTNNQRVCYVDDTLLLIADPSTECRDPKENQTSVPLPQMWSGNADLLVDDSIT